LRPTVWGGLTNPKIALWIPGKEWLGLSDYDRESLGQYARSLISVARSSPDDYIDIPRSAPLYNEIRSKVENLCDECWGIGLGYFEGSDPRLLLDNTRMEKKLKSWRKKESAGDSVGHQDAWYRWD
jgi:hypothetical protein